MLGKGASHLESALEADKMRDTVSLLENKTKNNNNNNKNGQKKKR